MIDAKLKEMILPNIKQYLLESDWRYIDYMLEEVYLINEKNMDFVVIKPLPTSGITMKFYVVNGAFAGTVINWEEVKNKGILL